MDDLLEYNLKRMCLVRMSVRLWEKFTPEIQAFDFKEKGFEKRKRPWVLFNCDGFGNIAREVPSLPDAMPQITDRIASPSGRIREWYAMTARLLNETPCSLPKGLRDEYFYVATQIGSKIFNFHAWLINELQYEAPPIGLKLKWTWYGTIDQEKTMLSSSHESCAKMRLFLACDLMNLKCVGRYSQEFQQSQLDSFFSESLLVLYCVQAAKNNLSQFASLVCRYSPQTRIRRLVLSESFPREVFMFKHCVGKIRACRYFWEKMKESDRFKAIRYMCDQERLPVPETGLPVSYELNHPDPCSEDVLEARLFLMEQMSELERTYLSFFSAVLRGCMVHWPWYELLPHVFDTFKPRASEASSQRFYLCVSKFLVNFGCYTNDIHGQWHEDIPKRLHCKEVMNILWRRMPGAWKTTMCRRMNFFLDYFVNPENICTLKMILEDKTIENRSELLETEVYFHIGKLIERGHFEYVRDLEREILTEDETQKLKEFVGWEYYDVIRGYVYCVHDEDEEKKFKKEYYKKILNWCQTGLGGDGVQKHNPLLYVHFSKCEL